MNESFKKLELRFPDHKLKIEKKLELDSMSPKFVIYVNDINSKMCMFEDRHLVEISCLTTSTEGEVEIELLNILEEGIKESLNN